MALHTIARRLRDHDWVAVFIEVLIVVAGVFIALQVTNWNEERKAAVRGDDYLLRLRGELLLDSRMIERMVAFRTQVQGFGLRAMAHAETGALHEGSAWKTLLAYYHASQIWPYRKPAVTFEEIRSAGDLGLIRASALRARIADHYSDNAGSGISEVLRNIPDYRESVRGLTPWPVQEYIWKSCFRTEAQTQEMIPCDAPVSEEQAQAVLDDYRSSPDLLPQLRFWMATNALGMLLLDDVRSDADALAKDIDSATAR